MKFVDKKICVVGLGYVGLPLARLFSTKYQTIGFDMNQHRVDTLMNGHDATLEISDKLLQEAINNHGFVCTTDLEKIKSCNVYIVAVPTPVNDDNTPDLKPLWGASEIIGQVISKGDIVIYESTVYPGVTEEECLPVVEKVSGLRFNVDFFAGYSPERINPGDKLHTVEKIKKVTSGSTPEIADIGENVKIYQGVTLGALSTRKGQQLKGVKRHPTIRDNVTIYSGTTILGGETVIGKGATIGGNAFIVNSITEGMKVSIKNPELQFSPDLSENNQDKYWYWMI